MREIDLELSDGRTLHVYDTDAERAADRLAVFWHHGTPNIGAPPEPLFPAAKRLGIRWVSYDRPGYGGSTRLPGRNMASAASDSSSVADALGIDRFAVMGHSGGGSHAVACAALLPERVLGVVSVAGLAPFGAEGLDWFAGMAASGQASLRAAAKGRAAKEKHEASGAPPWGCDPAQAIAPALFLHGGRDRVVPSSHGEWLARRCPRPSCGSLLPRDTSRSSTPPRPRWTGSASTRTDEWSTRRPTASSWEV